MKKLIFDMHGNPGGYLNQAFDIADEFISEGQTIVYTKGRNTSFDKDYISTLSGDFEDLPVICISDRNSASASEIVLGAIQDLDRGLIVGETTYGKGLVQRQYSNPDGSGYRITTSRYYTPSGRCIQRPFDDLDKYENFVGRIDLPEGIVLQEWLQKLKNDMPKDSIPLYNTKKGRLVPGGGGITPDYIVKNDTITGLTTELKNKRIFFIFADDYINKNESEFRQKYENNFTDFLRNFNISKKMLKDFRELAEAKKIKWNDKDYSVDSKVINTLLKSEFTRRFWNNNEFKEVILPLYKQIDKARELFPEAEKLAGLE